MICSALTLLLDVGPPSADTVVEASAKACASLTLLVILGLLVNGSFASLVGPR